MITQSCPTKRFVVVLEGTITSGHDPGMAKVQLAALIQRDIAFAEKLLSGRPTKIKTGVEAAAGARYIEALERIGVAVRLEPETLEIDAGLGSGFDSSREIHTPEMPVIQSRAGAGVSSPNGTPSKDDCYRAALGPTNQAYYLAFFRRADSAGKLLLSWNWPALLCSAFWALYRKMYLWFFVLWVMAALSTLLERAGAGWYSVLVGVLPFVVFPVYANSLYHYSIKKRIEISMSSISGHSRVLDSLRAGGGVHKWVPWVVVAIPVIGILAAIAVPAYQDYSKRGNPSAVPQSGESRAKPAAERKSSIFDDLMSPTEEARQYRERADSGEATAQYNLGVMYELGKGVPQDPAEAVTWYRKSADQGLPAAQSAIGRMYLLGLGVPKDATVALEWYRMAADNGDAAAQNNLGAHYEHGLGIPRDYVEAAKWYRRAADQGNVAAQANLGNLYLEGQGVARDYLEAAKWSRMAADQGMAEAQYNLALQYVEGQGVPQDFVEALKWLILSASGMSPADANKLSMVVKGRDRLAEKMTPTQIAQAQKLAREWTPK